MTDKLTETVEPIRLGTKVRVLADELPAEWREDWRGYEGFVSRIDWCPVNSLNYELSDEWPPRNRQDGFTPSQIAAFTPPAGDEVERVARVVKAACLAVAFGSPLRDYPGAKLEPVHFDAARQILAALSRPNVDEMREALEKFERVTQLADTLSSDVPITPAARGHITAAYECLSALRGSGQ